MERLPKAGMGVPDGNHHHHNDCFFWEVYYDDWNIFPVLVASFAFVVFVACCVSSRVCFSSGTSDAWKARMNAQRDSLIQENLMLKTQVDDLLVQLDKPPRYKGRAGNAVAARSGEEAGGQQSGGKSDVVNVPLLP